MYTKKTIQTLRQRRTEHAKLDGTKQRKQHGHHRRKGRRSCRPPPDPTRAPPGHHSAATTRCCCAASSVPSSACSTQAGRYQRFVAYRADQAWVALADEP